MAVLAPGSPTTFNLGPGPSQADMDIKRKVALALMQQGASTEPVQHWAQGLGRVAQALIGGYGMGEAQREDEADREKARGIMQLLSGGATSVPQATPPQAPIDPTASQPGPGTAPAAVPRGIRNNNPLNIEAGDFTRGQPGFVGSDGRFAKFETPDQGLGAANALLDTYRDKHGLNTVRGIVGRWAPAAEAGNNTNGYVASVASRMGVDPDQPLGPEHRAPLIAAMGQFENGRPLAFATPAVLGGQPDAKGVYPADATMVPPAPSTPVAPVGAPVDQPRGGLTDARRQQLIMALSNTRAGAPMAQALFAKELDREANRARPLTEDEKKIYPGAVAIEAGGKPIFPPPSTNVQLSTVANPVLEGVGKQVIENRNKAELAVNTIPVLHDARRALDEGATTGLAADWRVKFGKLGALFGFDASKAENSEVFMNAVGREVLAHAKALGPNPSNTDRDYIKAIEAGDIKLEEGSIRRLLDISERQMRNSIKLFNSQAKKLIDASPEGTYKQIAPLMNYEEPPAYVAPEKKATVAPPPPVATTPPPASVVSPPRQAGPSIDDLLIKYGRPK